MFLSALAGWGVLALLFAGALYQVGTSQARVAEVSDLRYRSYLLADELRQSSDDLTRLARTYVVTKDEKYEQEYQDILDIRSGKKPRPDGSAVPLLSLMTQLGFSEMEFDKLNESQKNRIRSLELR